MGNTLVFLGISVNAREALIALGALSFALMLPALRLWQGRRVLPVLIALPFGAAAALYLGRLIQWYCLSESYTSLGAAMSDLRTGGFSLVGVFAAAIGCAWLLRLTGAEKDIRGLQRIAERFDDSLTLITCEDERVEGGYANRRIIAAKPIGK